MRGPKTTVILQKPTETDAAGTWSETWSNVETLRKAVFGPLTVTETFLFAKETVTATHRVCIGYHDIKEANRDELVEANRLLIDGVAYDIEAVMDLKGTGRHYELILRK